MIETINVCCPECKCIIVVNKKTGEVVEMRKPILEDSTGDRFKDAFEKVKKSPEIVEEKFRAAQEKEKNKFQKLDELFKEKMKEVKEKGEDGLPPERPYDLD
jgi:predicted nucleotide-binding protein (sugar kinase/HSP70/actin superfamily)